MKNYVQNSHLFFLVKRFASVFSGLKLYKPTRNLQSQVPDWVRNWLQLFVQSVLCGRSLCAVFAAKKAESLPSQRRRCFCFEKLAGSLRLVLQPLHKPCSRNQRLTIIFASTLFLRFRVAFFFIVFASKPLLRFRVALACMPSSPIILIESFSLRSMPVRVASIYQYSFAAGFTPSHPAAVLVRFRTLVGPPPCPCNLSWKLKACRLTSLRGQSMQVGLYQPSNTWWIPRRSLNRSYQKSSARLNSLGCKIPDSGGLGRTLVIQCTIGSINIPGYHI